MKMDDYRSAETEGAVDKKLVRKIAKHANIREDIVSRILLAFRDVAAEEIVNKGYFYFRNFFRVTAMPRKGNDIIDRKTGELKGRVPDHHVLQVRLSVKVRRLFQMVDRPKEDDKGVAVTRENWLDVFDRRFEPIRGKSRSSASKKSKKISIDDFLGEDDE